MTQSPPKKTDTPEVWPMIVADVRSGVYASRIPIEIEDGLAAAMTERDAFGCKKHGESLRVECGRDALTDALEEALDLCAYTRQQYEQTERGDDWETHVMAVKMAARVYWRMRLRDAENGA